MFGWSEGENLKKRNGVFIHRNPHFWRRLSHLHNFLDSHIFYRKSVFFDYAGFHPQKLLPHELDSRNSVVIFEKITNKRITGNLCEARNFFYKYGSFWKIFILEDGTSARSTIANVRH